MADTTTKILSVDVDVTNAVKRVAQIKEEIKTLKKEIKSLAKDNVNGNITDEQYNKQAQQKQARIRELTHEQNVLNQATKQTIKLENELVGSYNQLNEKLKSLIKEYKTLDDEGRKSQKGKELIKSISYTDEQIKKLDSSIGRHQRNVGNYSSAMKNFGNIFSRLGLGVLGLGQAMIKLRDWFISGTETAITFNREVSKLAAIMQTTTKDITELSAQAKQLGANTRYTATQVASLQVELAKLGYKKSQILNMSEAVLYFAQATGSNLAEAAALAGASLRIFGADSMQTTEYVDMMATATAKSALSFDYIRTALPIVGSVADAFGFKLNEVLAILGQLANAGIDASMAATATRNIFLKLADANGELAKQIGKPVKTLPELVSALRDLRERGLNLGDAFQLVGARATNAFTNLTKGTKGVEELSTAIQDCTGAAEKMAEVMENNLGGAITSLESKWQDLMLNIQKDQGILKWIVDFVSRGIHGMAQRFTSKEDSMEAETAKKLNEYLNSPAFKGFVKKGIERYEADVDRFVAAGEKAENAKSKALQNEIDLIDSQLDTFKDKLADAELDLENWEKTYGEEFGNLFNDTDEQLDWTVTKWKKKYGEMSYEVTKILEYQNKRNQVEWAKAKLLAQETRKEQIEAYSNGNQPDTSGLNILSESDRKKLQDMTIDAEKRFWDEMQKAQEDGINKQIFAINEKYDQQKLTIRKKLQELGEIAKVDLTQLELMDEDAANDLIESLPYDEARRAAEDYYNALVKAEENKGIEIKQVTEKFTIDQEKILQKHYETQKKIVKMGVDAEGKYIFQALVKNSDDEFAIRKAAIEHQKELDTKELKNKLKRKKDEIEALEKYKSHYDTEEAWMASGDYQDYQRAVQEYDSMETQIVDIEANAAYEIMRIDDEILQHQLENIKLKFEAEKARSLGELETLRIEAEEKRAIADNLFQRLGESNEEFALRQEIANKEDFETTKKLNLKKIELYSTAASYIVGGFHDIVDAMSEVNENNRALAKASKILALAEISINTGKAIATGIAQAQSVPYPENLAAIASTIAAVLSGVAQAISTVNKAKFAKGAVDINGAGTTTSDSIPVRISQGESIMTAKATDMFGNLLVLMNKVAAQPNVTLPTTYSQYNPMQTAANNDSFNESMRDAVADIHPVVSVEEINRVTKRYNNIKVLDNI